MEGKAAMNKRKLTAVAVALALILTLGCKSLQRPAEPQRLAPTQEQTPTIQEQEQTPSAQEQKPTAREQEPTTYEPTTYEPTTSSQTDPAPEIRQQRRRLPATCIDGSPLTVTGADSNQTNYKCGSGATGAYTN
jgi:hypothetical protein